MVFKIGSKGKNVERIQKILVWEEMYDGEIDGIFGQRTKEAVMLFQKYSGLNSDGIVGPKTWHFLVGEVPMTENEPLKVPYGIKEIYDVFGDPLDSCFWKAYSAFIKVPYELKHAFPYVYKGEHGFWAHKKLKDVFQEIFQKIVDQGLETKIQTFDGCYNVRNIRGGEKLSTHSWGIAIDLNARDNPLGADPKIDRRIVKLFQDAGFTWGGTFFRKDGMHFQFANSY